MVAKGEDQAAEHQWERELLEEFADPRSRNRAFERLVRQYQKPLYYHIRRMVLDHDEADDLVQNTLIRCYQALDRFEARSSLYTWLYRIATNLCLTHLEKKRKRRWLSLSDENTLREAEGQRETLVSRSDSPERILEKALLTLPPNSAWCFKCGTTTSCPTNKCPRFWEPVPGPSKPPTIGPSKKWKTTCVIFKP